MTMLAKTMMPLHRNGRFAPPARKLSEAEFVDWCDGDTWAEWVKGEVQLMSPVSLQHGQLHLFLVQLLGAFVEANDVGSVFSEPVQVRLGHLRRRRSPDILFVSKSRSRILRPHHVEGAPDLIIEIVSPESEARDWREKYLEYQAAGVREYWVIDPMSGYLEAYALRQKRYRLIVEKSGKIHSTVLKGFYIRPAWLFGKKLSKVARALRELRVRV